MRHILRFSILFLGFLTLSSTTTHAQWEYLGVGSAVVKDMAAHGGVIMTTGGNKTLVSADGGATWTEVRDKEFNTICWAGDGFFIGKGRGDDFKTDPTGMNWQQRGYCSYEIKQLFFDTLNGSLYAANMRANAILESTDTGGVEGQNTWLPIGTGLQDQTFVHARLNKMIAYYNGIEGLSPASMRYSLDGGASWKSTTWEFDYFGKKNGYTTGAWIAKNGDFYATGQIGPLGLSQTVLYRSRNDGQTWDSLFSMNEVTPLLSRSVIYTEGSRILVTANDQVWLSADDGATWTDMKGSITGTGPITTMAIDHGYLFLLMPGTNGQEGFGIYRRPLTDFGFTGIADVARTYKASQSNLRSVLMDDGSLGVELTLDRPNKVRIVAMDVLGRELETIYEGFAQSGKNRYSLPETHRGFNLIRAEADGVVHTTSLVR